MRKSSVTITNSATFQVVISDLRVLSQDVSLERVSDNFVESTVENFLERMGEISALTDTEVNSVAVANLHESKSIMNCIFSTGPLTLC